MVDSNLRSPITVQRVSGALRSGGFRSSKASTTAVKGWHEYSEGFKVVRGYDQTADAIHVGWRLTKFQHNDPYQKAKLKEMAEFLRKQGFLVEEPEDAMILVVRLKS